MTSRATAGLASNVWGSVLGLDMIALACTYLPPTWLITSAYSFSAPTATILPRIGPAALAPIEQAERAVAATAAAAASSATRARRRRPPARLNDPLLDRTTAHALLLADRRPVRS